MKRLFLVLLSAVIMLGCCVFTVSASIPESAPHASIFDIQSDPTEISITSGGKTIYPMKFWSWSTTWMFGGWLHGDAPPFQFEDYRNELPTVTLSDDISLSADLEFQYVISKENPDWQTESSENFTYEKLSALEPGVYYVKLSYIYRLEYVPDGNDYNKIAYNYYFKLVIGINASLITRAYDYDCQPHEVKIFSVEDLDSYLYEYHDGYNLNYFDKNKYNESFFAGKFLYFSLVATTGSSPKLEITSVSETTDSIEVGITRPIAPSPDMAAWILVLEMDRKLTDMEVSITMADNDNGNVIFPGDINRDGQVDSGDLAILISNYGKTAENMTDSRADLNDDTQVDSADLSLLISNYIAVNT